MTNEELLLSEGAAYFGNRLIYKNQDIGVTAPGAQLVLFPEADAILANLRNITDVEVKPARTKKARVEDVVASNLDDLLG